MSSRNSNIIFYVLIGLICASAVGLLIYSTPQGLGLSDDSIAYIAGARSILNGMGYREIWLASSQPVTHFPPGFSSVLAVTGWLTGLDPLRGTRLVNGILFGLNTALLGILGWQMTQSRSAGMILALFFAVNASMLSLHADAMSEPLYIFLSLLAFLSYYKYFTRVPGPMLNSHHFSRKESGKDWQVRLDAHGQNLPLKKGQRLVEDYLWLVITACLVGLAYLTRYAGLALLAAFPVALVFLHENWRRRLASTAVFIAGALPWMIAWGLRNRSLGGTTTNRALDWHPITTENFDIAIYNVSEFLIPIETWRRALIRIPGFFEAVLFLLGLAVLIWIANTGYRRFSNPASYRPEIHSLVNALYGFAYLASVIFAMTFFDASTKFRLRILAPIYLTMLVLLVAGGMWLWARRSLPWRTLTIIITVLIIGLSLYDTSQVAALLHKGGQGYASFQWYDSEAIKYLRGLAAEVKIYTNEPGAVYLYTGRGAYVLPSRKDPVTAQARPGFETGVSIMQAEILAGKAVLALFDGGETQLEDAVALSAGLYLAHKSAGDAIYAASP